jgi:hypothetical protein
LSAKASDGFDNLGDAEKVEFALTELAALQARVDKLLN